MQMKPAIRLLIFDLDGTLYDDVHHFDYYARALQKRLQPNRQKDFWADYEKAREDQHTLRVGRIYDSEQGLILVHKNLTVQQAFTWQGQSVPFDEVQKIYPQRIVIDMQRYLSVGDLWWVPGAIARHYGITPEQSTEAFLATRRYMMTEEFTMTRRPDLIKVLQELQQRGKKLVLMTNSPEPDSQRILEKLGLQDVFHHKQFTSQKPTRTLEHIGKFATLFNVGYPEILSVGDNWLNEISPANDLGCRTLYIDAHDIGEELVSSYRVNSLQGAIQILQGLVE